MIRIILVSSNFPSFAARLGSSIATAAKSYRRNGMSGARFGAAKRLCPCHPDVSGKTLAVAIDDFL